MGANTQGQQGNGGSNGTGNGSGTSKASQSAALPATIEQLLNNPQRKEKIAQLLPRHLTPERLMKVALNTLAKTPDLQTCTAASLLQCIMTCAELGLEPGGALGHAYLIPFKDKSSGTKVCTLIIGYRGFIELARRSGQLEQIEAHIVFAEDEFKLRFGLNPELAHTPKLSGKRGTPLLAYMVARLKGGAVHVEVMTAEEILAIRKRSKTADSGPWVSDEMEMWKKTVLRRGAKYLPMSAELARAVEEDDRDFEVVDATPSQVAALPADTALVQEVVAPGNAKAREALKAKRPQVVDVAPGESEEAAKARAAAPASSDPTAEPPEDLLLPGQRAPGEDDGPF